MWLNCIYGGKGVGMINLLLFLIIGIFLAGQMVGRTPEYLGRKIGATRDEARDDRAAGSSVSHPGAVGAVRRDQLGNQGGEQSRRAWIVGDRLPVLVVLGE